MNSVLLTYSIIPTLYPGIKQGTQKWTRKMITDALFLTVQQSKKNEKITLSPLTLKGGMM